MHGLCDGDVALGVADAGAAVGVEAGEGEPSFNAGGFGHMGEVAVDVVPCAADAKGPLVFFADGDQGGLEGFEIVGVGVVKRDRGGFARLAGDALGAVLGEHPSLKGGDGVEVVGGDGGIEEIAVLGGVVNPCAVFTNTGEDVVGDDAAHAFGKRKRAAGANGDQGAIVLGFGVGVVLGNER